MRRIPALRLDLAVAAVVLLPFATIGFGFRESLMAQAAGICLVVAATLPSLLEASGRRRVLDGPPAVMWGSLALMTATILGAAVGLVAGHAPERILGQAVSMGLLPAAALAGAAAFGPADRDRWIRGLLGGLIVGCWIQLGWGAIAIVWLGAPSRLFLPNSVSVVGPALMGLCFAVIGLGSRDRARRRLAWIAGGSLILVVVGSSLRSLWILAPVAVVALIVVIRGWKSRPVVVALALAAGLVAIAAVAVLGLQHFALRDRPDLVRRTPCALFPDAGACVGGVLRFEPRWSDRRRYDVPIELPPGRAWRVIVHGSGGRRGAAVISLNFRTGPGDRPESLRAALRPGGESTSAIGVGTVDPAWTSASLRLLGWKDSAGTWSIERIEIAALERPLVTRLSSKALAIGERVGGLVRAVRLGRADGDATLGFRWHESRTIAEAVGNAPWSALLFGRGLGATVHLDIDGFDNRGHWVHYDDVNYIHNWYLFLLFKLGLVGTVLVLGTMAWWVFHLVRAFRREADSNTRAFLAAAAAAWIVYAVWSVTSPEILDFRMAPLWGWLSALAIKAPFAKGASE